MTFPMRATIKLYIDIDVFEREAEKPLDLPRLQEIAEQVNNDAASIPGYESYTYEIEEIPT